MIPAEVKHHVPLSPKTSIRLGGPARYFLEAEDVSSLREALEWAREGELPVCFLGGGSNLVFADAGWPGLVVGLGMRGVEVEPEGEWVTLRVMAGENWDDLVARAVSQNWAGIECLSGIPGLVGATPIQNVGAYGQEVADCLQWVEALDVGTLTPRRFSAEACGFSYRTSVFKEELVDRYLVTAVGFRLRVNGPAVIRYPDLKRKVRDAASLAEVRAAVLAVRAEKAMVLAESEPNSRSCGSFFTNPILSESDFVDVQARSSQPIPSYPAGPGRVKLPAAWLIENAGFAKGFRWGQVGLSEKHTLALINRGNGTSRGLLEFAQHLRKTVFEKYGVSLSPEPVIWTGEGKRFHFPGLT